MKKIFLSFLCFFFANAVVAVTCDDIRQDPNSYFVNMVANPKDNFEYLNSDFSCQDSLFNLDFLKSLYDLSVKIRGESIDCVGNLAIINEKKFQEKLALIAIAPKVFENGLDRTIGRPNIKNFEPWAHKSFKNFSLFKEFKNEYENALINLTQFFGKNFDENYAKNIAELTLDEYLKFAFDGEKGALEFSELEKLLLENEIDLDSIKEFVFSHELNEFQLTNALNTAILQNKNQEILNILIQSGANVNYGDENSVFFASNSAAMVKFLIQNGADINYKNSFGITPIFYAVEQKDSDLLKFFIYNRAKINVKFISDTEKMAYISNNYEPYRHLCAFNEPAKTLLMYAAELGGKEITEMLVKNGANEFAVDDFGLNALDYAVLSEDNETIKYLKDLGLKESIQEEKFNEDSQNGAKHALNLEN